MFPTLHGPAGWQSEKQGLTLASIWKRKGCRRHIAGERGKERVVFVEIYERLQARFREEFGVREDVRIFFAPGRVNLIGEHTDYNGGYVFPAALTYGTWALAAPRQDGVYRFASVNFPGKTSCEAARIVYRAEDGWANYPKGVLHELAALPECSPLLKGADLLFFGNIPNGAGLSSSASVELASAAAVTALAGIDVPMVELVKLAQRAENRFVGVRCGIMDQFAVGMGKKDHAIMLKCDTLAYEYVPFRIDGYKLVIANSNKRRALADSTYNERRRECEEGLRELQQHLPHLRSLGDLCSDEWRQVCTALPNGVIRRRVEHVVAENERVIKAAQCLAAGDLHAFGRLMKASHESLRDLYEVTGFELDALFEAAAQADGCIGTRMTGAGFGGCTVSLVKADAVDAFKRQAAEHYTRATGLVPDFYVCELGDGVGEVVLPSSV